MYNFVINLKYVYTVVFELIEIVATHIVIYVIYFNYVTGWTQNNNNSAYTIVILNK